MATEREKQIRMRAYEIWEREGRPEGREQSHWQQAAQEIASEGQFQQEQSSADGANGFAVPGESQMQGAQSPGATPDGNQASSGQAMGIKRPRRPKQQGAS